MVGNLCGADRIYRKAYIASFIDFDYDFAIGKMGNNGPLHKNATPQ